MVDLRDTVCLAKFYVVNELDEEINVIVKQFLVNFIVIDAEVAKKLEALSHDLYYLVILIHYYNVLNKVLRLFQQADY